MPPAYARNPLYTDEFKASVKHAYTETNEAMWSIAARHGFATRTLEKMVAREGWPKRRERVRTLIPAQHLLDEAQAMLAAPRHDTNPLPACGERVASPPEPEAEAGEPGEGQDHGTSEAEMHAGPTPHPSPPAAAGVDTLSPQAGRGNMNAVDRIERLVLRELEIEEARREKLGEIPRPTAEAATTARTLAVLTQTLDAVQRLRRRGEPPRPDHRPGERNDDNDMPKDLDEFRRELARRIDAFVASRTHGGDAGSDPGAVVDGA